MSATRAALWFALALVGQAVTLQLIDAGPHIRYQHFKPWGRLLAEVHPVLLVYLLVQGGLVAAASRHWWSGAGAWSRGLFRVAPLVAIGAVFVLSSAPVSPSLGRYVSEVHLATLLQVLSLATFVCAARALPRPAVAVFGRLVERVLGEDSDARGTVVRIDRFALLAALWVTALAAALGFWSYGWHPHVPDEVAYLYQARFLAAGALTMPEPPVPEAFELYLMHARGGAWFPSPPAGWPAALAAGVWLGVPWLVNPVLAGVNVLLSYLALGWLYNRWTARLAVIFLCVSPWNVFMGMNLMTHTFSTACALAAGVALIQAYRTDRARWAALGGAVVGVVSLVRPLEGVIVGGLLGLVALGAGVRRLRAPALAAFALAGLGVGGLVLPYNWHLTGDPLRFPIMAYTDARFGPNSNAYGFGPDRGMGWPIDPFPGHGVLDALVNANLNTFSMNVELFGWGSGSLFLAAIGLFWARKYRADWLMVAAIAIVFTTHFFYYFSGGPDFGARYWFLMLIPVVVLTVRGIEALQRGLAGGEAPAGSGVRVLLLVAALSASALVNYFPWRAVDKYHHYLGMRPDVRTLAVTHRFGRSVVLVRGVAHPDYASAAAYNPVDVRGEGTVYAWDRNTDVRRRLLAAYPDRPVWIVRGPSLTGRGFEVAAGPLSPTAVLARREP